MHLSMFCRGSGPRVFVCVCVLVGGEGGGGGSVVRNARELEIFWELKFQISLLWLFTGGLIPLKLPTNHYNKRIYKLEALCCQNPHTDSESKLQCQLPWGCPPQPTLG